MNNFNHAFDSNELATMNMHLNDSYEVLSISSGK